jgi:hypothetical protein
MEKFYLIPASWLVIFAICLVGAAITNQSIFVIWTIPIVCLEMTFLPESWMVRK